MSNVNVNPVQSSFPAPPLDFSGFLVGKEQQAFFAGSGFLLGISGFRL
jgi:hypothetical protein